ncbi:MAG: aminotransferase class III-fold pyridoxal phosphate-dependent enzyme [Desulfohalobiaceae bacterium]|nr:aminotransferase class III-fold pyridoxal phosphate-dependent enzyme [Desulfohalobiaceae bacterium]
MDKVKILNELLQEYTKTRPGSKDLFEKSRRHQIDGGSHNLRLFSPFPFYDQSSKGSRVTDVDGHTYVDFWQGHFANILGHNPPCVLEALQEMLARGQGLITGFPGLLQQELAELILGRIDQEKIRFTTSGALATMYAVMLARTFTGKNLVIKVGGGWHGAQPYLLKGVSTYEHGLNKMESAGLLPELESQIVMTRFNDLSDLQETFQKHGANTACLIVEPLIGAGGFISAKKEYLQTVEELCRRHRVLLIMDEVISGFRFHAGALYSLYGIKPDLTVLGKSIGGGMPVSALAGREEIFSLCSSKTPFEKRVKFEGGTFSAHPCSMQAGISFIRYVIEHETEIYPRIGKLGATVRYGLEEIFRRQGFSVQCTGGGLPGDVGSSIVGLHFLRDTTSRIDSPEEVFNPEVCDQELRGQIFKLAMLLEGYYTFHGYGAVSAAHSEEEIQGSLEAAERIARKWNQ